MKAQCKIGSASHCRGGFVDYFETTLARSKTKTAGSCISGYAKAAAISSVGKRSRSRPKWSAKKWHCSARLKSKTKAERQCCNSISSQRSKSQAASPGWLVTSKKQNKFWTCKQSLQPTGSSTGRLINSNGTEYICQRWPLQTPPNALRSFAFYTAMLLRFMTQPTNKSSIGLKPQKHGQLIKSHSKGGPLWPPNQSLEAAGFFAKGHASQQQ